MGDQEVSQEPIISGLPDDIALFCVARVPRRYHQTLRRVSRRWRDLVCSEEWYCCRRKQKLEEAWIYALCQDHKNRFRCYTMDPGSPIRHWKPIRELPSRCWKRKGMSIEVLGNRIYLMGGETLSEGVSDEVYSYDASTDTWSQAPSLSTPRCYFGCQVVDEKMYALGGLGLDFRTSRSWETYDPRTSTWTLHSDHNMALEITDSCVVDGKINALCGDLRHTLVLDTWRRPDADVASGWRGPTVVADGRLYMLEQELGLRLMVLEEEWAPVGRLSTQQMTPPCQLAAVGSTVFVVGKGLGTIGIDVGMARTVEGAMVCSSMHYLNSYSDVISCRCLAI